MSWIVALGLLAVAIVAFSAWHAKKERPAPRRRRRRRSAKPAERSHRPEPSPQAYLHDSTLSDPNPYESTTTSPGQTRRAEERRSDWGDIGGDSRSWDWGSGSGDDSAGDRGGGDPH